MGRKQVPRVEHQVRRHERGCEKAQAPRVEHRFEGTGFEKAQAPRVEHSLEGMGALSCTGRRHRLDD
jgi:hypothetical protein